MLLYQQWEKLQMNLLICLKKVTFNKVKPDPREKDTLLSTGELVSATLLAMSIKSLNVDVLSLSGQQAGIPY